MGTISTTSSGTNNASSSAMLAATLEQPNNKTSNTSNSETTSGHFLSAIPYWVAILIIGGSVVVLILIFALGTGSRIKFRKEEEKAGPPYNVRTEDPRILSLDSKEIAEVLNNLSSKTCLEPPTQHSHICIALIVDPQRATYVLEAMQSMYSRQT